MVYHSENPQALKGNCKGVLPVVWQFNKKAYLKVNSFMKAYCERVNIPCKIFLLLVNAPGYLPHISDNDKNIKVMFFPPITT